MGKKFYNTTSLSVEERKDLFEKDPINYVYSLLHEIVDRSFDLTKTEGKDPSSFGEVFPFEVITQTLNLLVGVYGAEFVFERMRLIEQEFMSLSSYNKIH